MAEIFSNACDDWVGFDEKMKVPDGSKVDEVRVGAAKHAGYSAGELKWSAFRLLAMRWL